MATALDLLMSAKEDVNLLSEESDICTIDAKTRIIFVPSTIVVGGVQSDKNAERIKFSCPKIVGDNLDLSKFSVRINFENVSSVDFNVSIKDQYICDDVAVDGENVTFSWLIGRNAARYMGTVRFIVCAVKTDSDSNISVEWNTAIAEVPVLEGIEIDQPQIGQEEKDVINQLLELTKNTSAEAIQNVNFAKEQAIKDIQSVSQPDTTLTIEGGLAEAKATGEAIGSLKEDLRQNTEQNFLVIKKSYTSSDYTEHTIDINIAPIIGHSKVIIEASIKSYGYFTAYTANGTLKNGVEIPNQICNIGDLKIAEGFTNDNQTTRVIIYSTNDVSVDITIKIAKKFEIIVSQDGRGDFDNLDDALNYASDDEAHSAVIIVRPGTYNMRTETPTDIPYKKENRYLTIIGEDKYKCIIRNDNGYFSPFTEDSGGKYYDSSPLRLGGDVTIQNLTVISTAKNYKQWVSEHPEVKGVDLGQSYCIHHDMNTYTKNTCLIKDCILINDHYDAIGAGNRPNHTIQIENCEITTTTDFSVAGASANGTPIFIHSYNPNSGNAYENQNIVIKNNILINTNQNDACYFYASNPDSMRTTLIGNVCKTADTASGFRSYGNAFGVYKTDLCFGNNIETMNN